MSLAAPTPPPIVRARPTPTSADFFGKGQTPFGAGAGLFRRKPTPVIGRSNRKSAAKPSLLGG